VGNASFPNSTAAGAIPDHDRDPIMDLMRECVETLNDQYHGERKGKKRKTSNVAQSDIVRIKIAGVRAENTRKTQSDPISRAKRRNVRLLH
jgi:hypothetical protein